MHTRNPFSSACEAARRETPAQREARRLRAALRTHPVNIPLYMVCMPREVRDIFAELTPRERQRIRLLTSWPWAQPALASEALAAA